LICADANTPDQAFWDMSCQADRGECPTSNAMVKINLDTVDSEKKRKIKWYDPVPSKESMEWNCKYFVTTKVASDESITDHSESGYVRMATITGGYNSTVWLMV